MTYSDYLKSAHWQEVRKKKIKRSKGMCVLCGSKKKLHVHHKLYVTNRGVRILGKERPHELAVLCSSCHATWHSVWGKDLLKAWVYPRIKTMLKLGIDKKFVFQNCYNGELCRLLLSNKDPIKHYLRTGKRWLLEQGMVNADQSHPATSEDRNKRQPVSFDLVRLETPSVS